jgi:hypothetical protein
MVDALHERHGLRFATGHAGPDHAGIAAAERGACPSRSSPASDDVVTVSEDATSRPSTRCSIEKTVAEGAGAAGLAAALTQPERFKDRTVALVITGGRPRLLASVVIMWPGRSAPVPLRWRERRAGTQPGDRHHRRTCVNIVRSPTSGSSDLSAKNTMSTWRSRRDQARGPHVDVRSGRLQRPPGTY